MERAVTTKPHILYRLVDRRDEHGQILVLVMAMLVIVGIFAGALAGLATPTFHHAAAVRNLNDTVAAADSGINYGIQALQGNPAPCLGTAAASVPGTPPAVNTGTLAVTCQGVQPASVPTPPAGVSYVQLTSTATPSGGSPVTAKAVVQVNETTGSATIESWRVCQDGASLC
jgi:Tfp pilus assembly protein PilX